MKWLFTILFIISVGLLVYFISDIISYKNERNTKSEELGKEITADLAFKIDSVLKKVMAEGNEIAAEIAGNAPRKEELLRILKTRSRQMPSLLGITAAFEPFAFDENTRLFAPYYDKSAKDFIFIEDVYDYTDPALETSRWYVNVMESGRQWVEPYYAEGAQAMVADYGIPISRNGKTIGTVTMTLSLKGFADLLRSLSLGEVGYGFVISKDGTFLAHPDDDFAGRKSLSGIIQNTQNSKLRKAYKAIKVGKEGFIQYENDIADQQTYLFYGNVKSSSWKIGVVFFKNDLLGSPVKLKKKYIKIFLTAGLTFIILWVMIFRLYRLRRIDLWNLSIAASAMIFLNIVAVWYLQHNTDAGNSKSTSPPINDNTILERFIKLQQQKALELKSELPDIIPTGIYIRRIEFDDAYNVNISGYLWQKYDSSLVAGKEAGFLFSQTSPFAEASYVRETYRKKYDDHLLIGWDFRTTLRLNFDYGDYPFEKRNLNIEIVPNRLGSNMLFVPDPGAYKIMNPVSKPGIDKDIVIPGNNIVESYFNFNSKDFDSDFGFKSGTFVMNYPLLYFNINIRRMLLNAFVSHLIPIFVVLLMMFILLYSSSKTREQKKGIFSGVGIIESLAAFFFVLIFSHIDLRKTVETSQLMYMEYFYIVLYMMLILYVYNLISFTRRDNVLFFDFEDNLIAKVLYWPLFLSIIYIITFLKFY